MSSLFCSWSCYKNSTIGTTSTAPTTRRSKNSSSNNDGDNKNQVKNNTATNKITSKAHVGGIRPRGRQTPAVLLLAMFLVVAFVSVFALALSKESSSMTAAVGQFFFSRRTILVLEEDETGAAASSLSGNCSSFPSFLTSCNNLSSTTTGVTATRNSTGTDERGTLSSQGDPRLAVETLFTSATGIGITTVTSLISVIASSTIIYVISRSSAGFGSIYNRILFGMSVADILQSVAMALTTIPMPRDMIYEQFDGLIVSGNDTTCKIQGFVYICGFLSGTMYTSVLCYYYLCVIYFRMKDATFKKYVEPVSHFINLSFSIILAALTWKYDLIHPTPLHPFCTTSAYPYWCRTSDEECMDYRIRKGGQLILWPLSTIFFGINAFMIIVSLLIIVCSIYIGERKLKKYFKADSNQFSTDMKKAYWSDFSYTKSVVRQSLYYVTAFIAVYIFHFLTSASDLSSETLPPVLDNPVFQLAYVLFRPSQGTFNLMIFLYHKIWSLRRTLPTLGFLEALKEVLSKANSGDQQDRVVSKIEIVMRDNAIKNLRLAAAAAENSYKQDKDEYDDDDVEGGSMYNSVDVVKDKNDHDPYRIQTPARTKEVNSKDELFIPDHGYTHDSGSCSNYGAEKGSFFSNGSRDIFSILDSIQLLGSSSFDMVDEKAQVVTSVLLYDQQYDDNLSHGSPLQQMEEKKNKKNRSSLIHNAADI